MGFSLTSTHLIFFITAVSVAGVVSGVLVGITTDITMSFSEKGQRLREELDTDFRIINDPEYIPSEDGFYVFYLKNIGDGKLVTDNETFQLFVDGDIITKSNYYLTPSYIYYSEVAEIHVVNNTIAAGMHQLRIVGPHAVDDTFTFTI